MEEFLKDKARFDLFGRLRDREAEQAYLESQADRIRLRFRYVSVLTAAAYLGGFYADTMQVAGSDLVVMACARAMVGLFAAGMFCATLPGLTSLRRLGASTVAYMAAIMLSESFELFLKASTQLSDELPISVFMVLLFYMILTPSILQSLVPGVLGSACYLTVLALGTSTSAGHVANTCISFAVANGFGFYFAKLFGQARRGEFLALEELRRRAETDSLTGILNRRRLMELAAREFNAARRYGHACAVLMFDIDHFKQVNDTHGHAAGDAVLVELAARCAGTLREVDLFGRTGGEEFLIVMPHCGQEQAVQAAERLRRIVADSPFAGPELGLDVTVSIGVAGMTPSVPSLDRLLQAADQALYEAKQGGRNRVCASAGDGPEPGAGS